jgi:hypothetical protein
MKTAPGEVGVWDQSLDARQALEELEYRPRVHEMKELARIGVAVFRHDLALVLAAIPQLEYDVLLKLLRREVIGYPTNQPIGKNVLKHDVRKRIRLPVLGCQQFTQSASLGGVHFQAVAVVDWKCDAGKCHGLILQNCPADAEGERPKYRMTRAAK